MQALVSLHSADPPNPWEGYQRALQHGLDLPTRPSHLLVLQDDVVLCRNLPRAVREITKRKPDDPVVLFTSHVPMGLAHRMRVAMKWGQRYVRLTGGDKFCPVVAVLWPTPAAEQFLDWSATAKLPGASVPGGARSDDAVAGEWVRRTGRSVWVTAPSLVEHPDEVDSIWKGPVGSGGRKALFWIGLEDDPLSLDWENGLDNVR